MARPAQTARSERTRDALRQAALVRFLAQGVEATSAEQIADDAGVSLRTFYRHFASKQDLLFADYDAGLHWFRTALAGRPADESIIESVQSAIFAFPHDGDAMPKSPRYGPTASNLTGSSRTPARSRPTSLTAVEVRLTETHGSAFAEIPDGKAADHRRGEMHRRRGLRRHGGVDARRGPIARRTRPVMPNRTVISRIRCPAGP